MSNAELYGLLEPLNTFAQAIVFIAMLIAALLTRRIEFIVGSAVGAAGIAVVWFQVPQSKEITLGMVAINLWFAFRITKLLNRAD